MPGKAIPSLGDNPEIATKLVHEEFPLPKGRAPLVAALERILTGGGVQKMVVELGKPIKVFRRVPASLPGEEVPAELYEDDMMAAVMNVEMEELTFTEKLDKFQYLFRAFNILTNKHLVPKAALVNQLKQVRLWLGSESMTELFGVPLYQHKEVPDGVLLLVGAKADEPDVLEHSLKMEMV